MDQDFPVPFTKDQLRKDLVAIHLAQLRMANLFDPEWEDQPTDPATPSRLRYLWSLDLSPEDAGLSFEYLAPSMFARALEQQYEFGFHALLVDGLEPMRLESIHTWVAALLVDLSKSDFVQEMDGYGEVDFAGAISRCLHVSELANARLALAGKEVFSFFEGLRGVRGSDGSTAFDALTIRQIALLAAMEEMSVRTAASRKGPNQLPTYKEDSRTLVRVSDAQEWLKSKGRYLAIRREVTKAALQLDTAKFASVAELGEALNGQLRWLDAKEGLGEELLNQLLDAFERCGYERVFLLTGDHTRDKALLTEIATILRLPPELLILRAAQAQLYNDLWFVEKAIGSQVEKTHSTGTSGPTWPGS